MRENFLLCLLLKLNLPEMKTISLGRLWELFVWLFAILLLTGCEESPLETTIYGKITGKVVSEFNGEPLKEASVSTNPASETILTDSLGNFSIENIEVGEYTILAEKDGYKKNTVPMTVEYYRTIQVQFSLQLENIDNLAVNLIGNPIPEEGTDTIPLTTQLAWTAPEIYKGKELMFDVYLQEFNSPDKQMVATSLTDTSYVVEGLKYNMTYFWSIRVKTDDYIIGETEPWTFKTMSYPGTSMFFTRIVDDNYEIFAHDTLTGEDFRVTFNPNKDWCPRKNPSGDKIAFVSNRTSENQIFTMNVDGSDVEQVTTTSIAGYNNNGFGFSWSPDGGYLIYPHYNKLYKVRQDGSDLDVLATAPEGKHFKSADWSRYGGKIVALLSGEDINDTEIYLMDDDGTNLQLLIPKRPGRIESPSISSNGKLVLFTHDADSIDTSDGRMLNSHIYEINLSTNVIADLSDDKPLGTNDIQPRYFSKGDLVVFTNEDSNNSNTRRLLWLDREEGDDQPSRTDIVSNGEMPEW